MAQKVQQSIFHKVTGSPFITIVADETTDVSNKEQLAFAIRHINKTLMLQKTFLESIIYCLLLLIASSQLYLISYCVFKYLFLKWEANAMIAPIQCLVKEMGLLWRSKNWSLKLSSLLWTCLKFKCWWHNLAVFSNEGLFWHLFQVGKVSEIFS